MWGLFGGGGQDGAGKARADSFLNLHKENAAGMLEKNFPKKRYHCQQQQRASASFNC